MAAALGRAHLVIGAYVHFDFHLDECLRERPDTLLQGVDVLLWMEAMPQVPDIAELRLLQSVYEPLIRVHQRK